MAGPTPGHPVGGSLLSVVSVVRPPKRRLRAYAALAPKALVLMRARTRRRGLPAVPIAITGSVGKTTTKNLLEAALATAGPTVASARGSNRARGLADTVSRSDRSTRFVVQEMGVADAGAGSLDELLWAFEPRVAVITTVLGDHQSSFASLDDLAAEKAKPVAVLPSSGLAVLNADDARVRAMADGATCRVVLVGRAGDADVRIVSAVAAPDGSLRLRLADSEAEYTLAMMLIGAHWALATALAFATATRLGADPEAVRRALETVPPTVERLNVVTAATGARFLLDTAKATEATVDHALAAIGSMAASRRIAVVGRLWDYAEGSPAEIAARVTSEALAVADEVVLYGHSAEAAPAGTLADDRVTAHTSIGELSDDLWRRIGDGDLVLLMGTRPSDHLIRVALRVSHDVRCRLDDCTKRGSCLECPLLGPLLQ